MRIRTGLTALGVALALGLSACGGGDAPLDNVSTTMHDNQIQLTGKHVAYVGFSYDHGYSISPGQPWQDPITVTTDTSKVITTIVAHAGRHATNTPADWFRARTAYTGFAYPATSNFAFSGYVDVRSKDGVSDQYLVVWEQYSDVFDNLWVMAGQFGYWTKYQDLCLKTPDQKYFLVPDSSGYEVWPTDQSQWAGSKPQCLIDA